MSNAARVTNKSDAIPIGGEDTSVELFRGDDSIISGIDSMVYRHYGVADGHGIIDDNGDHYGHIQFINIQTKKLRLQRSGNDLIFWTRVNGKESSRHNLVTVKHHFSDIGENKVEYLLLDNKKYVIDDLTRNLVGSQSSSVDLLSSAIPLPMSKASNLVFSLSLDDVTNPLTHLYHSGETSGYGLSKELDVLGQRYNFNIRKESDMTFWTEDNMWLSADGKLVFQPSSPMGYGEGTAYEEFVSSLDMSIPGAEEEGHHSLELEDCPSQGQSFERWTAAKMLVKKYNLDMVKTLSVIDGGNMLTGRRANGKIYALVGRDAVIQTTLRHNYLDSERVAAEVEAMQNNGEFTLSLASEESSIFRRGFDPQIDLMLLEASGLLPEHLNYPSRLLLAKTVRAKLELANMRDALTDIPDIGNEMNLSIEQIAAANHRHRVAYKGDNIPDNYDEKLLRMYKRDYSELSAMMQRSPRYSHKLIKQKLQHWQPDISAKNRMMIMLKNAGFIRSSLSDKQVEQQAIRFLAMNEISKDIIADELGVAREDLVIVSQQEFHIDMYMRPLSDGRVMVHDYQEAKNLVQKVLDDPNSKLTEQNKIDLQQTMLELQQLHQQRLPISNLIEKQLRDSGLQPIKTPGVFSVGEIQLGAVDTEDHYILKRHVNYMNGVMGTSQKDNSMFYITNASSIEPLNDAISDWFKNHMPGLQVEFIGRAKMGEGNDYYVPADFNFAESLLDLSGGFDCITLHHGTATELLAENMASFAGQNEAVGSGSSPDSVAAAIFTRPSYMVNNYERAV
ncbi:hypothetical protein [Yersinia kristensenii]|uniref:hypothetical protein n=1 Tax=Yersinia kristensenii TaxID=28152 RepID=UPI001FECC7C9|nr:hypothetical protein [Yersinia kristensenii]MDA5524192.1 hypothetical protein [Yersinia kristensenii]MDX6736879.1 hypothetical protein [Yersinia kristensenii]